MSRLEVAWWVIGGIVTAVIVIREATKGPTPPDIDRLSDADRAKVLKKKREAAVAWMKSNGVRSMLQGHAGWAKVNPMAAPPEEEQPKPAAVGNVVRMRGQR